MKNDYAITRLSLEGLTENLITEYNRYQEVSRCLRKENNEWVMKEISYIVEWDTKRKQDVFADLVNCLKSGGFVWGVLDERPHLIAFASLAPDFFGSENQYLQVTQLQVSYGNRNQGIGKKLFKLCAEEARKLGAKKLYISTHTAEESQLFYMGVRCVDAMEINQIIAEDEPYDRQMEFVL